MSTAPGPQPAVQDASANSPCCPARLANLSTALKYPIVALESLSKSLAAIGHFITDSTLEHQT
jgi:hypothetical protein